MESSGTSKGECAAWTRSEKTGTERVDENRRNRLRWGHQSNRWKKKNASQRNMGSGSWGLAAKTVPAGRVRTIIFCPP